MRRVILCALRYIADAAAVLSAALFAIYYKDEPRAAILGVLGVSLFGWIGSKLHNLINPNKNTP